MFVPQTGEEPSFISPTGSKRADPAGRRSSTGWSDYGKQEAEAEVRFVLRDCIPDCASGKTWDVKASVVLSRLSSCRGTPTYQSMVVVRTTDEANIEEGLLHRP